MRWRGIFQIDINIAVTRELSFTASFGITTGHFCVALHMNFCDCIILDGGNNGTSLELMLLLNCVRNIKIKFIYCQHCSLPAMAMVNRMNRMNRVFKLNIPKMFFNQLNFQLLPVFAAHFQVFL